MRSIDVFSFFFAIGRYSITDEGCKLAEKLETVTGDSLSTGSTDAIAPFTSDSVEPSSHASIDLTSDRNLDENDLPAADLYRDSKPCIEKVPSSHDRFTRITEKEEEFKSARYGHFLNKIDNRIPEKTLRRVFTVFLIKEVRNF